jgi:hypothetical protein
MIGRLCASGTLLLAAALLAIPPAAAADQQFTLGASVDGLYPNANLEAPVTVHNPLDYPIAVHAAEVVVGDASAECPASNLVAGSFAGDVVIAAGGTAAIPIRLQMVSSAPNACQGVTFPLTFVASGEPAPATPTADPGTGPDPGAEFAFTGSGTLDLLIGGLATIAFGLAITIAVRRREQGTAA